MVGGAGGSEEKGKRAPVVPHPRQRGSHPSEHAPGHAPGAAVQGAVRRTIYFTLPASFSSTTSDRIAESRVTGRCEVKPTPT